MIVGLLGPVPNGYDKCAAVIAERMCRVDGEGSNMNVPPKPDAAVEAYCQSIPVHMLSLGDVVGGSICIAVSKARYGLPEVLADLCTSFIHVPHVDTEAVSFLLDTPSCLSIALHEITSKLRFDERLFEGHKYDVAQRPRHSSHDVSMIRRMQRMQKREDYEAEAEQCSNILAEFDMIEVGDY